MPNANRLDWVDAAKGLSIILVVMMHSAYGVGEDLNGVGVLHYIIGWAAPFRMPEFFLISGLFLSQVIARPWLHYTDRRVVHYLYFYALWAVLQIAFKVGLGTGDVGGVATQILWAVVEPYGVLWFIYMLAVYSLVAKVLYSLKVPHWAAFGAAALLQIFPVTTGIPLVDHFAAYSVYFYAGYAFAPLVFRIVAAAQERPALSTVALLASAVIEGILVFSGGATVAPRHMYMGYAALPVVHLVLAFVGALAVCVTAALLVKLPWMSWLRWLGERSIVIYLSFSIPMAASRTLILKTGLIDDVSVVSVLVMTIALVSPLVLYWLIKRTGWGKFLFERPAWAHIPGAPGSRSYVKPAAVPAE
ncbi:acyltransferase family protein [Devosia sp. ZB163]|uniref:acyltransferase family protein n=1 Tax=Devosia sp. ZB163 TaxID=3025938 RepID=UPI002361A82C|nr:acyltransferase family protein [Devosia sp. ZB163]MDC9824484.1 acyltransferase family protein [Devosia sp. ZB163]